MYTINWLNLHKEWHDIFQGYQNMTLIQAQLGRGLFSQFDQEINTPYFTNRE